MTWRLAESLKVLREQVNEEFATRSKASDGTVGDPSHQTRSSDHNPWIQDGSSSVVSALDLTHDPKSGFDSYRFAESLMKNRDPRIKYIISNHKIVSGNQGPQQWVWRGYTGKNPHNHHVHISVKSEKSLYDSKAKWKFEVNPPGTLPTRDYKAPRPTIRRGDANDSVKLLQELLTKQKGFTLVSDGDFGPATEAAVKDVQRKAGLIVDGIVGPATWEVLGA